ncbi:pyridoxamine kinase [Clostridium perfringens]|uniref:pyridoxamine kinase n=1 Tax=Clostridium perfringens TaxID=1502 RepID=UPI00244CEA13|nr:pyridoxamine kinase [Clostridium perfringens]MDH2340077.1 pyridoxamine kinase [Clostridium perfringens]MDK0840516.1 pyridoxamine kinase [Clostridium perfringens]MDK0919235.1 pyridoxamine kinase [Clostridium perfringens]MDK0982743.1 pyridoxamine kinase [Clostridium perfringens]MDN4737773.1 pyridoxamine kinase [Clostridium perfringens]
MKPMNKIAAIHDISCYGRAALATIIPILSSMGNQVCPLPTAVLSTHTDGFGKPAIRDLSDFIYETKDHWKRLNLNFQCIYSGYLADPNQVKFVERFIEDFKEDDTLIVIDPVMADNGKLYDGMSEKMIEEMRTLIKSADIITPNITEASFLLGKEYKESLNEDEIKEYLVGLGNLGPKISIITSVASSRGNEYIDTVLYDREEKMFYTYSHKRINAFYCGTGDAFASLLIGWILRGKSTEKALEKSCNFIAEAIEYSEKFDYPPNEGILLESLLYKLISK